MPVAEQRATLQAVAAALLCSSGGLFIKMVSMPALALVCGRAVVASAFFLLIPRPRLSKARWTTALAYAGTVITFVAATKLTTAANAVFLQYTGPAYILMLAPFLLKERFRGVDAACVALSLAGMSLILIDGKPGQRTGDLIALASGVFYALSVVFLRRDARDESATVTANSGQAAAASTLLGNMLAAVLVAPFAWSDLHAVLATRAPSVLPYLFYLGVFQLGLSYLLIGRSLRRLSASTVGLIMMLEPVFNPVWVFLGLGERPTPWALAGGVIVLGVVAARSLIKTT